MYLMLQLTAEELHLEAFADGAHIPMGPVI